MKNEILSNELISLRFNELIKSSEISPQKRGFEFEELIKAKLNHENLEPKSGYKPRGEQIDGSFFWQGKTFLLEAKWVKDKIPASTIYAFKGKVDGKFHTTSGIFIAVNGYSDDAIPALKDGKVLNLILFDSDDVNILFNNLASFTDVLKFKLREAGDTGQINAPFQLVLQSEETETTENVEILIFVEGFEDSEAIGYLIDNIEFEYKFNYKVISLNGIRNLNTIPSIINLNSENNYIVTALVIIDEDEANEKINNEISNLNEIIESSSLGIETGFHFIPQSLKSALNESDLAKVSIMTYEISNNIKAQIDYALGEFYFDPETDYVNTTLNNLLNNAKWDLERETIEFVDDSGQTIEISEPNHLAQFLNEEIVSIVDANMPLSWLKQQSFLHYEDEAREFLHNNFKENLIKLNWDTEI